MTDDNELLQKADKVGDRLYALATASDRTMFAMIGAACGSALTLFLPAWITAVLFAVALIATGLAAWAHHHTETKG